MTPDLFFVSFERSVEILAVCGDLSAADLCSGYLTRHKLYRVAVASTAAEADSLLSSKQFHVCLFDPGLSGINGKKFSLLKKYASKVSFIVVSGPTSIETGFRARECGAFSAISSPVDFTKPDILNMINEAFFRSLIIPENMEECKPAVKEAINSFMSDKPGSVVKWAEKAGIEKRYLRRIWVECFGYPLKYVVWLQKIMNHLFFYYNSLYFNDIGSNPGTNGDAFNCIGSEKETSLKFFYANHTKGILQILDRRKNLVKRAI